MTHRWPSCSCNRPTPPSTRPRGAGATSLPCLANRVDRAESAAFTNRHSRVRRGVTGQRRAGPGDPASNALGRVPSRGGIYDAMYKRWAMTHFPRLAFFGLVSVLSVVTAWQSALAGPIQPLALHPQNPHYFLFRGKPTVLITSGEHYGAVLNLDFDYAKYLDTLAKDGLNLTRTFSGAYVEPVGAFNIASNTLAPGAGRFICPWARGDTPGYANGGNKFDLTKWDETYFKRLKDFVAQAGKRGIVVEMNLFCPMNDESQWRASPLNAINKVKGIGEVGPP